MRGLPAALTRRTSLALAGLAGFGAALAGGIWLLNGSLPRSFAWGGAALLVCAVWLALSKRVPARIWIAGLFSLSLLDWLAVDRSLFAYHPAAQVLSEGQPAIDFLSTQAGLFRIYSPSYSLPQQVAARAGLQLADGVDPLQLRAYTEFLDDAAGITAQGYSVTLPPFLNGEPEQDNVYAQPDAARLGLLNIRYVAAAFDLDAPGLELVQEYGQTRIYENRLAKPRAWVGEKNDPVILTAPAEIVKYTTNSIELRAAGPGRLVLSEVDYPGWRACVDGQRADILPVEGLLRSVDLAPGEHTIRFAFRPLSLYMGFVLCALGIGISVLVGWVSGRK
jgi:hypothetical protein